MAHGSTDCTRSMIPASASGQCFREPPIMAEGKEDAGMSHGNRGSKRWGEVSCFFKHQLSCELMEQEVTHYPEMAPSRLWRIHPHNTNTYHWASPPTLEVEFQHEFQHEIWRGQISKLSIYLSIFLPIYVEIIFHYIYENYMWSVIPQFFGGTSSSISHGYQNPWMLKYLIWNSVAFGYNLCTSSHNFKSSLDCWKYLS